jgi:hypothetical protein
MYLIGPGGVVVAYLLICFLISSAKASLRERSSSISRERKGLLISRVASLMRALDLLLVEWLGMTLLIEKS